VASASPVNSRPPSPSQDEDPEEDSEEPARPPPKTYIIPTVQGFNAPVESYPNFFATLGDYILIYPNHADNPDPRFLQRSDQPYHENDKPDLDSSL